MIFHAGFGKFVWSKYKLINLTADDPYFSQILAYINT